jgi:hypothetical protein
MSGQSVNRTADGAEIILGMPVWNYDLRLDWVESPLGFGDDWYVTRLGAIADGARLLKRHPLTGQLADDAVE